MVARRALGWLAAAAALALIFIAVAFIRRVRTRAPAVPVPSVPTVQRTIAVFEVRDTTKSRADSANRVFEHVKARIDASAGVRVVGATISPNVDVGQLSELLNARSSIELRSDGRVADAAFRRGDSVLVRRVYPLRLGTIVEDSILNLAAELDPWIRTTAPGDTMSLTDDAGVRSRRADSLFNGGNAFEALREARRAHELEPLSAAIHLAYATLLERSGREADAARERDEQKRIATILNPTPKDQIARARFKHVPKRPRTSQPPRQSRRSGSSKRP